MPLWEVATLLLYERNPLTQVLWKLSPRRAGWEVVKGAQVRYFHFAGSTLILDVEHAPKLQSIQLLSVNEASDRLSEGAGHAANHNCPRGARNPQQLTGHPIDPPVVALNTSKLKGASFSLKFIHNSAIALIAAQ